MLERAIGAFSDLILIHTLDADSAQFIKGSSPPPNEDTSFAEPEVPTEVDSDDQVILGRKRSANTALPDAR